MAEKMSEKCSLLHPQMVAKKFRKYTFNDLLVIQCSHAQTGRNTLKLGWDAKAIAVWLYTLSTAENAISYVYRRKLVEMLLYTMYLNK